MAEAERGLWREVTSRALEPTAESTSLWDRLKEKVDLALYQPQQAEDVEIHQVKGRHGTYFVLKNPEAKTYLQLTPEARFLWDLMDGSRSIKDLIVAYYAEYGSFALATITGLVQQLRARSFLADDPINIIALVSSKIRQRGPMYLITWPMRVFLMQQLAISGLDRWVSRLYRWGGRLLFSLPVQLLFLGLSVGGLVLFAVILNSGQYDLVKTGDSYALGLAALWVAFLVPVVVHEGAHALTIKHFGREVRRGGLIVYMGLLGAFVEDTDMWLEGPRPRIAVKWAGPYSGLILAGAVALAIYFRPDMVVAPLLFKVAFFAYVSVFFNVNPLIKLDGYYILMDWLDIPNLRERAMEFVRRKLPGKLLRRERFSRQEVIFAVFGLLAGAWTIYFLWMITYLWRTRLVTTVQDLLARGGVITSLLFSLFTIVIAATFLAAIALRLVGLVLQVVSFLRRSGLLANRRVLLRIFVISSVVLAALGLALSGSGTVRYGSLLSALSLGAAVYLVYRWAMDYRGSDLARALPFLGVFLGIQLLASLSALGETRAIFAPFSAGGLRLASFLPLAAAAFQLARRYDMRKLGRGEQAALAAGLVLSPAVAAWATQRSDASAVGPALLGLGLLAFALIVPTVAEVRGSPFFPPRVLIGLALLVMVAQPAFSLGGALPAVLGTLPLLAHLLLLSGLLLRDLTYRWIAFPYKGPGDELAVTDQERLRGAFLYTMEALFDRTAQVAGGRSRDRIEERLNLQSTAAGWRMSLVGGRLQLEAAEESILDQGEIYQAALSHLMGLVAEEMGSSFARLALTRAYDRLPWHDREVAAPHLFAAIPEGQALNQAFEGTKRDRRAALQRVSILAGLEPAELDLLASRMTPERYRPGEAIIRQGEAGDKFYVIWRGRVAVSVRDESGAEEKVAELGFGDFFGEAALLSGAPRNATCKAVTPSEVLSLDREDFKRLVQPHLEVAGKVERAIEKERLLLRMPHFGDLSHRDLKDLAARLEEVAVKKGEAIIRQGEQGDAFYIIKDGRTKVTVQSPEGEGKEVAELGPGEYFGEMALLVDIPRTATVTALSPLQLLKLDKSDFDEILSRQLYVSQDLERVSSRRMIDLVRKGAI